GHGWVDLKLSMAQSCDVYYYDLAHKLGIDRLSEFTSAFGFGDRTDIDNTNERPGNMPTRAWKRAARNQAWFPGETLSAGIGQGYVLATPLQMAVATAALANRGVRHAPRLVRRVGNHPVDVPVTPAVQLSKEEYWDVAIDAMREVVHGARGTARLIS